MTSASSPTWVTLAIFALSLALLGLSAYTMISAHLRTIRLRQRRDGIASGTLQSGRTRRIKTVQRRLANRPKRPDALWATAAAWLRISDLPPDLEAGLRKVTIGLVIAGLLLWAVLTWSGLHFVLAALIGGGVALLLRRAAVNNLKHRRAMRFIAGFNEAIEAIARSTRSGVPLVRALEVAAGSASPEVRYELSQVVSRIDLGEPFDQALARLEAAVPEPEVELFVACLTMQIETGGSLSDSLQALLTILRKRRTLALKVITLTSEVRSSATAICVLVPLFAGGMFAAMPDYFDPFFATGIGKILAAGAGLGLITGITLIVRLARTPL